VPPKVEVGPDGKPRLMCVSLLSQVSLLTVWVVFTSEAEDHEPVNCKVEDNDNGYNMPASLSWSSQASLTLPVENVFHGDSLYPLSSSQGHRGSNGYGRASVDNHHFLSILPTLSATTSNVSDSEAYRTITCSLM
jgi:hypothetical protein